MIDRRRARGWIAAWEIMDEGPPAIGAFAPLELEKEMALPPSPLPPLYGWAIGHAGVQGRGI